MSAFGAGIGKAVGGLGGPQVVAIVVAGGLVAGAIGGGILGGGGSGKPATSSASLAIYPCPDSGPALATVGSGQKFLVTGKNGDASWVRIYYPLPGRTEAWVTSGPLKVDGSLNDVPVVPCSPVEAGPGASVEPGASLTAIEDNSPSPAPASAAAVLRADPAAGRTRPGEPRREPRPDRRRPGALLPERRPGRDVQRPPLERRREPERDPVVPRARRRRLRDEGDDEGWSRHLAGDARDRRERHQRQRRT